MPEGDLREFRDRVRTWLAEHLRGEFARLRGLGGPGREHEAFEGRVEWERELGAGGWNCLGWPVEHGGQGATLEQQVVFHEEYALADAPAKVGHFGQELLGPTLIAFGTPEQQRRFLPPIVAVDELWCQGYSEPGAGSDLAAVSTSARLDGDSDEWVVTGQKVWTSLAHVADWCFVVARTEPGSTRHHGLSYLLVPMRQSSIDVRPIRQLTGTSEFNEVFFDGARTNRDLVVGEPGDGWRVAMGTLAFERGVATLGQQVGFRRELTALTDLARRSGVLDDPIVAERVDRAWVGLEVMRAHAVRTLGDTGPGSASVAKLVWANWHRSLGELAMLVRGAAGILAPEGLDDWQRLYLFSRADTIYGGSDEIQRNIIAERVLGLPRGGSPVITVPKYPEGANLLRDKVVVVTAAAGTGIGSAAARRSLEEGARVVISDWHERRLGEKAAELAELGEIHAIPCDVTREDQVQALVSGAVERFGRIDVLVNNAGLGGTRSMLDMTDDEWLRVIDVTLNGTFRATRAALRQFVAQGTGGAIVNNASVLGWRAQGEQAHYAAAKAGVMALTRCAAVDAAPYGVRINAVAPSLAMHPFLAKVTSDELLAELTAREVSGRAAEPWEVANVIVFLASEYSSYLTGEVVSVSSQHA